MNFKHLLTGLDIVDRSSVNLSRNPIERP